MLACQTKVLRKRALCEYFLRTEPYISGFLAGQTVQHQDKFSIFSFLIEKAGGCR